VDRSEKIVRVHLHHRGYDDVVFEPIPNSPPDFVVNKHIGIEVRRLNHNYVNVAGKSSGLEEDAVPLRRILASLIPNVGPLTFTYTWMVVVEFARPLMRWSRLKGDICEALRIFAASDPVFADKIRLPLGRRLALNLERRRIASPTTTSLFSFRAIRDLDSEGILITQLQKNIAYCSQQKERKIARVRHIYDEWWLALVDHIARGAAHTPWHVLPIELPANAWHRILVISHVDPRMFLEATHSAETLAGPAQRVCRGMVP
jgi:hypothetical protein